MSRHETSLQVPKITATSQQSRFHTETLDTSAEVDLKSVTIAIGDRELVTDSRLRLKEGVRYALVGRNGTGKSTLLHCIADKLIPGLGKSLRIVLVSQITDSARASEGSSISVLKHVVQGDSERTTAMHEFNLLTQAVESHSLEKTQRIVSEIRLSRMKADLEDARKVASRTSGTRGKKAREDEMKAEQSVKEAEIALQECSVELDILDQASKMLGDITTTLDFLDSSTTESRAASILVGLGFSQQMMDSPYASLSGGWRSRCALATALLVQSDILLLDEPSNFLDLEATLWLEQYLNAQNQTLVLTSHDQVFLNNVVEETILLRNKTLRYFEGTPRAFDIDERKRRKALERTQNAQDKKREHIERSIQQGRSAAKQTGDDNKLRMAKSRQKKLDERWGVETSAKGTRFKLNRDLAGYHLTNRAEIETEDAEPKVKITLPDPPKLRTIGDLVHFDSVSFKWPKAAKATFEGVTFTVDQGGRCAFVGANGQGKSTLAKIILGELSPTKGTIVRHPLLKIGYFSQHSVEELTGDSNITALQYFLDYFERKGEKVSDGDARACLGSFGLGGKISSEAPLRVLSGGQKVRLALALVVYQAPPLLLLDEVTTHVDAPTIHALAVALRKYTGAIILITHDRWFSRVVVEGCSISSAQALGDTDGDQDVSDSSSDEETDSRGQTGKTFHVGGGKVRLLEGGMTQYVQAVERKLAKRQRLAAAESQKKKG